MAAGPPPRPRLVLDEERNNSFMKKLGDNPRPYSVPLDAERQSAAAIRAIADDEEDARVASSSTRPDPEAQLDFDVEARQNAAAKPTTLWTRLQAGWEEVEDRLAEWFGLDQSKYQWAVDELLERQLAGDQPASKTNVDGLQMQNIQEQSMQRDLGASNF